MPRFADVLAQVRAPNSPFGARISKAEMEQLWDAAKAPEAGEPAGKPINAEEAAVFQALKPGDLTNYSSIMRQEVLGQIPALLQNGVPVGGAAKALDAKRGHPVFVSPSKGFAVDAAGTAPASATALARTMHHAGQWLQASFGSNDNLFTKAGLDTAGKRAVLAQFKAAQSSDISQLPAPAQQQLLGSMAALCAELLKSVEAVPMMPAANAELTALKDETFAQLKAFVQDPRLSALVKRSFVGYLAQSQSFLSKISAPQKTQIADLKANLFPQAPADYVKWEAQGKSTIVLDHVAGGGENFLFGFVKELQSEGLNKDVANAPKFTFVSGDPKYGPAVLKAVVPANHPMNAWGREMTIECRVREMHGQDMYKAMGDPSVDVMHYGGHSNFGNNTLNSLKNAPPQQGDKIIARDLCCGADTKNAEAKVYPDAALNSVTSVSSSYFRTKEDPQMGKYAYESEGYAMLMGITRGLLGKKGWDSVAQDLQTKANWYGHDSTNNWTWPTDPRAGSYLDDDEDGISNVFDLLPAYDATNVAGSTAREFELTIPTLDVDDVRPVNAWRAVQAANTATNYNPIIQPLNKQRKISLDPTGALFDAKADPQSYAKFRTGQNGEHFVQLSSALAGMSAEALRPIVQFAFVQHLAAKNPNLFANAAERNAMALLFATSSLEYDDSWRDSEIFAGVQKLYGIPASVTFGDLQAAVQGCEERHNYTGDRTALTAILATHAAALGGAGVGEPAVRAA